MTIEIATLPVKPENEDAFVDAMTDAVEILRRQPGCAGVSWGKRVEPDLAYVLEVTWNKIEDHFAFQKTSDRDEFLGLIRDHLADTPSLFHFDPNGK